MAYNCESMLKASLQFCVDQRTSYFVTRYEYRSVPASTGLCAMKLIASRALPKSRQAGVTAPAVACPDVDEGVTRVRAFIRAPLSQVWELLIPSAAR